MKLLISPAKTLDLTTQPSMDTFSVPELVDHSQQLIDAIKPHTPADIASLMKLSDKLATLNVERYQAWQNDHTPTNSRPAIYTFMGDVYTGFDAYSLSKDDILYAQQSLRILSGLYGVLKPLDLMQAYRLEMGTKLNNSRGSNLYQFWGDIIVNTLNDALEKDELLVNLASNEYFKAVNQKKLNAPLITPNFLDEKNGTFKVISFYAKKARGLMARYLVENRCQTLDELNAFDVAGYRYDPAQSTKEVPVFIRPESAQPKK
ncbi:peroxide stress protein YaaA [Marinomonas sp. IMCC 4694]|uniref:peroxide stress protein YaaA n=1 Tax=Marinomonas sp. IMCC 4694 TaxID=2605432 RepID=UPI0011E7768F|nr:peroxide stress protein YaaA [Marinomonas sp. IMCC 4694]TYL48637.1 peroxide stress protein YaaA [Marinomonas sp. IMCC 4694]